MDFDAIFDEIKEGVKALVKTAIKSFADDARNDMDAFLDDTKADLKRYVEMLARGDLDRDEFEFLVKAKATRAKMLALSAKGISKARVSQLRDNLKDLILNSVFSAI